MDPRDLHGFNTRDSLSYETRIAMAMVQHAVTEVQPTENEDDSDDNTAVYTPIGEMDSGDLHASNTRDSLFDETGIPMATVQDAVIEVQTTENEDDLDDNTAVYTTIGSSEREQWHCLDPTPHLDAMYGPGYNQPYPDQVPLDGTTPQHPVMQRSPRRYPKPTAPWTPYSSVLPQAYQQLSLPVEAAGGPGANSGECTSSLQRMDLTGGGAALAGDGVAAAAGSSVYVNSSCPQNQRDAHNEGERRRRARVTAAFESLRQLVPGLSDQHDHATVCEWTAQYTRHQNGTLVAKYGQEGARKIAREFLEKFQPH